MRVWLKVWQKRLYAISFIFWTDYDHFLNYLRANIYLVRVRNSHKIGLAKLNAKIRFFATTSLLPNVYNERLIKYITEVLAYSYVGASLGLERLFSM